MIKVDVFVPLDGNDFEVRKVDLESVECCTIDYFNCVMDEFPKARRSMRYEQKGINDSDYEFCFARAKLLSGDWVYVNSNDIMRVADMLDSYHRNTSPIRYY